MAGRVFVTGATGAIGPHAVRALIAAGYEVTALVRSDAKAGVVARLGAQPVFGSLFDTSWLTTAFEGHDAVINLATSIPGSLEYARAGAWKANARIREEGSTAVVDAAISAGVPRLVQESIALAYPDRGEEWIDESVPLELFPIATSTAVAERNIQRFSDAGGAGVVLRFGLFYGPGSAQSEEMLLAARFGAAAVLGAPKRFWSPINLEDAGTAVVAALTVDAGTYNIVDDEPITKAAFGKAISDAVGVRPWIRGPGRLVGLAGVNTSAITRSLRVSNQRFKAATTWAPRYRSAREGWQAMAATGRPISRRFVARALALVLGLLTLPTGLWATLAPSSFYSGFPGFRQWLVLEPPYNEHLISDLGGFYLALSIAAFLAAVVGSRGFLAAVGVFAVIEATPHQIFHTINFNRLGNLDGTLSAVTLLSQIAIGCYLIWASASSRSSPKAG